MILRARQFQFVFPRPAVLMGIVNVTPDSFSDGGAYLEPDAAVEHGLQLVAEGAEVIDIGGESTRPNAEPVSEAEELRRVLPVIQALRRKVKVLISIDTYKPAVARAALEAGAGMINDVGAARQGAAMWRIVAESGAAYVTMHMQGTPQTMQVNPVYTDVRAEVRSFFERQLKRLVEAGVSFEQLVLDVGIGFGKKREHNLELLAGLSSYAGLGRPLLLGVSRKSFLGGGTGPGFPERLPAALAASSWAMAAGVQIIRTHDVKATCQAVRFTEEIREKVRAEA